MQSVNHNDSFVAIAMPIEVGSFIQRYYLFKKKYILCVSDPPKNCHLTVKKVPKTCHFFKKIDKNCHFFPTKLPMAIFLKKSHNFWQFVFQMLSFWQFF